LCDQGLTGEGTFRAGPPPPSALRDSAIARFDSWIAPEREVLSGMSRAGKELVTGHQPSLSGVRATSARAQNRTTRRSTFQRYDDKLNNSPPSLATCHQKALAANYQSPCQMTRRGSIADFPPRSLPRSLSLFLFFFLSPSCTLPPKQYRLDLVTPCNQTSYVVFTHRLLLTRRLYIPHVRPCSCPILSLNFLRIPSTLSSSCLSLRNLNKTIEGYMDMYILTP